MGRFGQSSEEVEQNIDIAPVNMIDLMLILLIFFIVSTSFVEEPGVEVDKPQAASSVKLEKNSILIALTAKGEIVYGGHDIGISGVQPLVKRMLQKENVPVIVQADSAAPSGILVRVIDEAKLGGAPKVSLATRQTQK